MNADPRDASCDRAYRDHANDVYRVAYGMLRDPDEALDATHDAFARAWERWDQYDSQRPLRPWLLGICVNVCLDQLRRRRVRRLISPRVGVLPDSVSGARDPAPDIVQRRIVEQAMDGLRPDVRAALVLRHYYGYDYAQIGELLGKPSGTVGSLLSRAHAALRERLGEQDSASDSPPSSIPDSSPAPRRQ
jgi:RNA polymerase sigma-70 factor, ECF subfamily